MKVYFGRAAQFAGGICGDIVDIPDNLTDEQIKELFKEVIGIPYNEEDCFYEILKENI